MAHNLSTLHPLASHDSPPSLHSHTPGKTAHFYSHSRRYFHIYRILSLAHAVSSNTGRPFPLSLSQTSARPSRSSLKLICPLHPCLTSMHSFVCSSLFLTQHSASVLQSWLSDIIIPVFAHLSPWVEGSFNTGKSHVFFISPGFGSQFGTQQAINKFSLELVPDAV